ncbi:MAG: hypothetical protein WB975_09460 [Nitrososphaeraceae archaeon]
MIIGIIATILLSLMTVSIGMNQAVYGQYYDYATGTYHATNTTVFHNVPAVNTTISNTQHSNEIPRESDDIGEDTRSVDNLIKQNQA